MIFYFISFHCLSIESIRLGGPAHVIVTKTVHKTLQGGGEDLEGEWVEGLGSRNGWEWGGGDLGVGGCWWWGLWVGR